MAIADSGREGGSAATDVSQRERGFSAVDFDAAEKIGPPPDEPSI